MSDGGEGMLDAFGGANQSSVVTGPLGHPVEVRWRLQPDGLAVIESAAVCGLALAGGPSGNDPMAATTAGVGELLVEAVGQGANKVVIGLGGSATTDGGAAARAVIDGAGVQFGATCSLEICCDVTTRFTAAAKIFGPQKGATPAQVELLTVRLERLRAELLEATGRDLDLEAGTGAAGGLGGGLALCGGVLRSGFDAIAEARGLLGALTNADLAVTGEGRLDASSLAGKVVSGVVGLAGGCGTFVLVVAGRVDPGIDLGPGVHVIDLSARFGERTSFDQTTWCIQQVVTEFLSGATPLGGLS
jgi:glycerate kinase